MSSPKVSKVDAAIIVFGILLIVLLFFYLSGKAIAQTGYIWDYDKGEIKYYIYDNQILDKDFNPKYYVIEKDTAIDADFNKMYKLNTIPEETDENDRRTRGYIQGSP